MNALDKILSNWTHEVVWESDDVINKYRCNATSDQEAIQKAMDHHGVWLDWDGVTVNRND